MEYKEEMTMKILRASIIVILALLFIPRVVHAQEMGRVYFYSTQNHKGEFLDDYTEFQFEDGKTAEEKAVYLFEYLFSDKEKEMTSFVPKGTELLWLSCQDGVLKLNMTKEGLNCAGNYKEEHFVQQIVKTAYSLEEIKSIIVYVEGEKAELPEGTDFSAFDR